MMITMYQSYSISKFKASVQRNKSEPQLTFLKCLHCLVNFAEFSSFNLDTHNNQYYIFQSNCKALHNEASVK